MHLRQVLMFTCLLAWTNHELAVAQRKVGPSQSLTACMDKAWDVSWQRFYLPKTQLFYDYLTSYEPGRELAHLPTADEVRRQYPNECGYGTGMEDCMISAGVMLSLIVDRYAVTQDESRRGFWHAAFVPKTAGASIRIPPAINTRMPCMDSGSTRTAPCAVLPPSRRFVTSSPRSPTA